MFLQRVGNALRRKNTIICNSKLKWQSRVIAFAVRIRLGLRQTCWFNSSLLQTYMAMRKPEETRDSKTKVEKSSLLLLAPNSKKQIRVWEKELTVRITSLGHFPAILVKQIGEGVNGYYLHLLSGSAEVGESGRSVTPLPLRWVGPNPTSPTSR